MSLSPGVHLGAYEIVALVGAGGMGEVYRARDTRLDRTVAIKILAASLAADPQLRDRLQTALCAALALQPVHSCDRALQPSCPRQIVGFRPKSP